jgi:sulfur dioxygenase
VLLARAGFARVANLAGGMLRWRAMGLPVVGGGEL